MSRLLRKFSVSYIQRMVNCDFVQKFNPISKEMEWEIVDKDYDYHAEIATSCYGDMLHDDERNKKFGSALKKAIQKVHARGESAHVLDIGTGTGLLAMLAVTYGADSVVACEMFRPVANCAQRIVAKNGFMDKIKLVFKHSTALTVGPGCDLPHRFNILVSEVFDTELIGEGAIQTFNHAHQNLLEENAIVIPSVGTIYGQVIDSTVVKNWNTLRDWQRNGEVVVKVPDVVKNCPGAPSLHDIQLSQLPLHDFTALTSPLPLFRFDFMRNKSIPKNNVATITTKALDSGSAHAIFMWWDLIMDDEGEILLSCAPVWHHPQASGEKLTTGNPAINIPWRDHWMQAVYFLKDEKPCTKDNDVVVAGYHDEFSLWFAVDQSEAAEPPACYCGAHLLAARTRIGALNDHRRLQSYNSALMSIPANKTFIVIGDFSLIGIAAANLSARRVYIVLKTVTETIKRVYKEFISSNSLDGVVSLHEDFHTVVDDIKRCEIEEKDIWDNLCILSEPFFQTSLLSWQNVYFSNHKEEFLSKISHYVTRKNVTDFVHKLSIKACCVQFDDLWKIRRPIQKCMGLDMSIFDDLINESREVSQKTPEPQPLWEYPCRAQSQVRNLLTVDLTSQLPIEKIESSTQFDIEGASRVDGIAVWAEFTLCNGAIIQTGPITEVTIDDYIMWDRYDRQGVHLFGEPYSADTNKVITCVVKYDPKLADFDFEFSD